MDFYFNSAAISILTQRLILITSGDANLVLYLVYVCLYASAVCKHIWIGVLSTGGKNNGDNVMRVSMVVDVFKESRTHMESIVSKCASLALVVKYL